MAQPPQRRLAILGSTGSIGCSTLEVVRSFPERLAVNYLTANKNIDGLMEQVREFHPRAVVVLDEHSASIARTKLEGLTEVLAGEEGLIEIVARGDVDIVLNALVGFAGLKPTLAAIEAGKDIALANKETLVVAGELLTGKVKKHNVQLFPVDSEHSAILQCLRGEEVTNIDRLILTASGGPFLHLEKEKFHAITVQGALNHPTWKMGRKITIDSATLMNKGLEVIEAFWLFGVPADSIEVVIHPQSIIHSMVEFPDGSTKAQMGIPDMKLPIQYALMYPERPVSNFQRLDFSSLQEMTFLQPDMEKFPCLDLAYSALRAGGSAPTVLNAANEVAVRMFLDEEIPFSSIPRLIEEALSQHVVEQNLTLDDIVRIDTETRASVGGASTDVRTSQRRAASFHR